MHIGNKQKSNKKVKLQTFKKKEGLNSGEKKLDRRAQGSLGSVQKKISCKSESFHNTEVLPKSFQITNPIFFPTPQ
jgi:hypothetical protein